MGRSPRRSCEGQEPRPRRPRRRAARSAVRLAPSPYKGRGLGRGYCGAWCAGVERCPAPLALWERETRVSAEGEGCPGGAACVAERGVWLRGAGPPRPLGEGNARQREGEGCRVRTRGERNERGDTTPQVARHQSRARRRRLHARILGIRPRECQSTPTLSPSPSGRGETRVSARVRVPPLAPWERETRVSARVRVAAPKISPSPSGRGKRASARG